MNASQNMKSGSSIKQQIQSIQLSQRQRTASLRAAGLAELFADAIVWVCGKVQRPQVDVFAKPSLKY